MSEISEIDLFVRVVESGGFSAAARQLDMTPSTVSRRIAQMEASLGARLFQRTTRRQSLTEAGARFHAHAARIVEEMAAAREAVAEIADAPSGELTITAEPDLAAALIAPLTPAFLQRHPRIRLRLSMSAALVDLVEGRIDVAIRMGRLPESSLIARRIASSRSRLCASPDYLARCGAPSHPAELAAHDCLSFQIDAAPPRWRFETAQGPVEVAVEGPVRANSLGFLLKMARAGCGIAMLPGWLAADALRDGALAPMLPDFPIIPAATPIHAVFAHNRHLTPKLRVFLDELAARIDAG